MSTRQQIFKEIFNNKIICHTLEIIAAQLKSIFLENKLREFTKELFKPGAALFSAPLS